MKNVRENQLKKCIFLNQCDFQQILCEVFDTNVYIHYSLEGCWYEADNDLDISDNDICVELSKYFDVNVTSVHIDDCEDIGIWVVYKEEE